MNNPEDQVENDPDREEDWDEEWEDEDRGPSKSQRKRDALLLLELGKQLVELSGSELDDMPLESHVRDAVIHAQKIKSNSAKKRQLHYLGKLLRKTDVEPIQQAMEKLRNAANDEKRFFHQIEQWRDDLLQNETNALSSFLAVYPQADRQQLRQLLRNCRRETELKKPPKSSRELFRWLRETMTYHDDLQ